MSKSSGRVDGGNSTLDRTFTNRVALIVTEYWHNEAMKLEWRTVAAITACILKAFDGETDPRELGVAEGTTEFDELEETSQSGASPRQ